MRSYFLMERERAWIWMGRGGREDLEGVEGRNHNQNILYEERSEKRKTFSQGAAFLNPVVNPFMAEGVNFCF